MLSVVVMDGEGRIYLIGGAEGSRRLSDEEGGWGTGMDTRLMGRV
jgi:hypothetical protein